jgi:predicted membrane protein
LRTILVKYGLFGGITGFVVFLSHLAFAKSLSFGTLEVLGYISIFISLSFIYFGIKHYRDHINQGTITIGKAILVGMLISLIVGIGIGIADYIYTKIINPNFFEDYAKMLIETGREDEIMDITSETAALFMLVLVVLIGFIISLISSLILQRK